MANQSPEQTQIEALRNKVSKLQVRSSISLLAVLLLAGYVLISELGDSGPARFDELIARQIVIQDAEGNDRIILAPQIASSASRLRLDTLSGLLILDANGVDRVIVGASPTVQSAGDIVRRVDDDVPYGMAFNDDAGNERGGFGYYAQRGLVSFGMDNAGSEGLTMFVADRDFYGQKAGIIMNREGFGQVIYIGHNTAGEVMVNLDAPGKGRLAMVVDSAANGQVRHFDYVTGARSTLLESK